MQPGRRRFLFGPSAAPRPLLPPWARPLTAFAKACTRCGECAKKCPPRIINASGPFPTVDFARGECTFCGECVRACPEPAFDHPAFEAKATPWNLVAAIGEACLARKNVVCRSCGDACETHAIRFRPAPGSVPSPSLDTAACTGCGACVSPCPVKAIAVTASQAQGAEITVARALGPFAADTLAAGHATPPMASAQ